MPEIEYIELVREVMVPVSAGLVAPRPIPLLPLNPDTLALGTTYKKTLVNLLVCNMQLTEIGKLK